MQEKTLFLSKKDENNTTKKETKNAEKQIKMIYRQKIPKNNTENIGYECFENGIV